MLPTLVSAQGTRDDYERAEKSLPWNVRHLVHEADGFPHWLGPGEEKFWYRKANRGGFEFALVNMPANTVAPAFDAAKLAASLSQAAHREYQPGRLPFDDLAFSKDGASLQFRIEGTQWTCTLSSYECKKQPGERSTREGPASEALSPDGRWNAVVRNHNLFVRSVANGQEIQLTTDGERYYDYATPLPSVRVMIEQGTEEPHQAAAVFWSPDSRRLVTYRIDSRYSGRFTTIQSAPPDRLRPLSYTYAYPLPGEMLARAEPLIFDIRSGKRIPVQTEPIEIEFQGGPHFSWFRDGRRFHFTWYERGYTKVELREVDADSGQVRTVIGEKSDTCVDPGTTFMRLMEDGDEIIWSSERDGWTHLYLYDGKTGRVKNQITRGSWVVRRLEHVDSKARQVYFMASGREPGEDPYQTHLYRVNFDGAGLRLLTPEDANHTVMLSPGGGYFVDNYSRPDLPAVSVLRRSSDGQILRELDRTDPEPLLQTGWKFPEPFHGKGHDGKTDIYGLIWRPSNFDPSKKYPVVEQIYTGPQGFFVPKTFSAYRNSAQATAQLGFITVMIDGLGTGGRSKAFHNFSYKNLGDGGLDDHIALLQQMAEHYPYIDLTRVGLYGGSAGGYDAAHALLTHPKFYKVAVSMSGNHDHRMDKAWWNELWMGYPVGDNYHDQSNVTMADKLEGNLLLIHGDLDDNVHPSATLQFANALIKANKDFDMLIVPNQYHGEGGNPYIIRRRWDYLVQHLLEVVPPRGFEIKREDPGERVNEAWSR